MVAFLALAQQCAATSTLDLMVALASVSSGFDPFTVSVGGQRHSFQDAGRAVAGAVGAMDQGQDAAIGLMGLSAQRLNELGWSDDQIYGSPRNCVPKTHPTNLSLVSWMAMILSLKNA